MRIFLIISLLLSIALPNNADASVLKSVDKKVYRDFPNELRMLTGKWIAKDKSALLGRNRKWGHLYSPRFQLGAGKALRISIVAGDWARARKAYLAINKGSEAIDATGYVKTTLPITVSRGRNLKNGDIASAASFYLGDACLGVRALNAMANPAKVAAKHDIQRLSTALGRGVSWLLSQRNVLMRYDRRAPNRLFFDALAFQACGRLTNNAQALQAASSFVNSALKQLTPAGYFRERGGWDTSYQAVSLNVGKDIILAGFESKKLKDALYIAANWLAHRIDNKGRIDSTGNSRTCGGGESFLGRPKKVALDEVFMSLAYLGVMQHDHVLLASARRIAKWYKRHSRTDPCFAMTHSS